MVTTSSEFRGRKRAVCVLDHDGDPSGSAKRADTERGRPLTHPNDLSENVSTSRGLSMGSGEGGRSYIADVSDTSGTTQRRTHQAPGTVIAGEATMMCCGMIDKVSCQLLRNLPTAGREQLEKHLLGKKYLRLTLERLSDRYQLQMDNSIPIATVNNQIAGALMKLTMLSSVSYVLYVDLDQLVAHLKSDISKPRGPQVMNICVNVYADANDLSCVGDVLSEMGIYLQDPDWSDAGLVYSNPHVLSFNDLSDADIWLEEMALTSATNQEKEASEVADWGLVLDHLPQHHSPTTCTDQSLVQVTLLGHQVDGLNFMLKRETGDLNNSLRYWHVADDDGGPIIYKHVGTRDEVDHSPAEPRGGILGDDMGLGKTLIALAVVASSLSRAAAFAAIPPQSVSGQMEIWARAKATLIVLPSELILKQWIDEIEAKLKPGSITYAVYHGQERARHFSELLRFDVVFTTYGTITKEHVRTRAREILYWIEWFRIVLDEAHVIRSRRTRQFTAIVSLQTKHPWCLTGTPISNKVDNLGALVTFCRVPLLEDHAKFRDHVTKAARRSFRAGYVAVQRTLAPLCLRRTKKLLNLPEPLQTTITVEFSIPEMRHYRNVMRQCKLALDDAISGQRRVKHTMLQSILQLRVFCNHGTFTTYARPCAEDGLDPDEALALLQQNDNAKCSVCSEDVLVINQAQDGDCGVLATCSHVLCRLCFDNTVDVDGTDPFTCPKCEQSVQQTRLQPWEELGESTRQPEQHFSKLERLMEDLGKTKNTEKSLVLSYWKKTIDLTSVLCTARGMNFVRIDGTVSQPDRKAALHRFVTDESVTALLMTMGTGALGLNLTAASRIHILEPQLNPAVEEQAIGRLVRIGQHKNINVLRYIVRDSIEEQIQVYQKRKIQLIAGGFGDSSDAAVEAEKRILTATFFAQGGRSEDDGS